MNQRNQLFETRLPLRDVYICRAGLCSKWSVWAETNTCANEIKWGGGGGGVWAGGGGCPSDEIITRGLPCVDTCKKTTRTHVRDPVVHVRVRWIVER